MPDFVARHKDKTIAPYVLSVPEGADVEDWVNALPDGWSLDKKTDPVEVAPDAAPSPATTTKEK